MIIKKVHLISGLLLVGVNSLMAQLSSNALEFDGTDDIAIVPIINPAPLEVEAGNFTLEVFFRNLGSTAQDQCILSCNSAQFDLYINNNGILQWSYYGFASSSNRNVADGQCHHVAVVRKSGWHYLYLDGDSINLNRYDTTYLSTLSSLYFGGLNAPLLNNIQPLQGQVKEVRFWNTARATNQIRNHMTTVFNNATSGLKGYWRCDEGSGNVLHDNSSSGNNGVRGDSNVPTSVPAWSTGCTTCIPYTFIQSLGPLVFCTGDSVTLQAFSAGATSYAWKKNGVLIPGAQSFKYTAKTSGNYVAEAGNYCGSSASNTLTVTVNPLPGPVITASGALAFCSGSNVLLSTGSGGTSYQWKKNGTTIPGATLSSYMATVSGNYKVVKTNVSGCSGTSSATVVKVYANPTVSVTPQDPVTFCLGDSVQLKANYNATYSYQWKKNNTNIGGAVTHKYTAKIAGNYKVKVTKSNGCTAISSPLSVTVPCRENLADIEKGTVFVVHPNPSSAACTVHLLTPLNEASILSIYDLTGRMLIRVVVAENTHEITVGADLPTGIYLIRLDAVKGRTFQRFIKTS